MMTLASIDDVLEIDKRIEIINKERGELQRRLGDTQKYSNGGNDKENEIGYEPADEYVEAIARDIENNARSLEGVKLLKEKYGALEVLEELEKLYVRQEAEDKALEELEVLSEKVDYMGVKTSIDELRNFGEKILNVHQTLGNTAAIDTITQTFNEVVSVQARELCNAFKKKLLESKWDASSITTNEAVLELRAASTALYELSQIFLEGHHCPRTLWNFQCIANNFRIRFTYHFHDDTLKMETYFKYLNDYLTKNLYKCVNIFNDESHGITKQLVHEQFINHVLQPIREKIEKGLSMNDMQLLVSLISQILNTDKNLEMQFHYYGVGMVSLVPPEVWDIWLAYEVETAAKQFGKITADSKDMIRSASGFIKLINKVFEYLKPFYSLRANSLEKYKLLSCSQIFISLASLYLDRLLIVNSLADNSTDEDQLYQTLMKLQNLHVVYEKIVELSGEYIFIHLTDVVNERENKNYTSLFQNVLIEYRKVIDESIQPTVIHRIKKLLKESLRNYFKIGVWSTIGSQEIQTMNSELVNAIKLISRIMTKLDSLIIPSSVTIGIKNELLNIIVNYFIESILKLNKFNQFGLEQFRFDFLAMRNALGLNENNVNVQECILLELLKVLLLKYDNNGGKFYEKAYIKESDYTDLRKYLSLRTLTNSEIQDALFRISCGNIL